ncbi:MAG: hypothetical protein ABFR19_04780 [Pseudomonadota bacterium]
MILAIVLALCSGCQSISERRSDEALSSTLVLYGKILRWQGPHEQGAMLADPTLAPKNRGITVTSYQVLSNPVRTAAHTATQTVGIEYVYHDSQLTRQVIDRQIWEYDMENQVWLRSNPPPEMPR